MYQITATNPDGSSYVLYDPVGAGALPILAPRCTEELNEAGSLEFALVYGHAAYDMLMPKKTYISVELDGRELMYGRVVNTDPSPMTGQIQYMCAGALSFLNDSEVPPDPKKSDGSTDFQTMTAEAFFRKCIAAHNADIGNDPRRTFIIGTISHSRKDETRKYQINGYNNTKSVLDQQLLDYYGGFLRTRRENGTLYIDWVEQYGDTDAGVLDLGRNIINLTNRANGEDLFTAIRPVGANGITLSGGGVIDIFPQAEMDQYGRIVRNVTFSDAQDEATLRTKANALVSRLVKTVMISSEISLVDLKFADEDAHGVNLGDVFTHIVGLEGIRMTVSSRNRDIEKPQNDSISLKSPKAFETDAVAGEGGATKKGGGISRKSSAASAGVGMAYKYIHEFSERLELNTRNISINADELELHADMFVETANEFVRLSHVTDTLQNSVGEIQGTGVIQNSESITELAGQFVYDAQNQKVTLIDGTALEVFDNGTAITVGERLTSLTGKTATFEGSALWTTRDKITGVAGEFDVETDPSTGEKTLIIKSGGGLKITEGEQEFGFYHEGSLTGGVIVRELNARTFGEWTSSAEYPVGATVQYNGHGYVCKTAHRSGDTFDRSKWDKYTAGTNTKIIGNTISLESNDEFNGLHSELLVTASQIRSEVHAANSSIYSYVDQTATYIWDHVGHSSMTYAQMDDPVEMPGAQMAEGDVWVQSPFVRTWDDAENLTWDEMQELQWDQLKGATVWVWKNGGWKKAVDETELAKDADLIRTNDYIKLFAKEQVAKNGQVDQYIADLTVTARQIRSDVSASRSELYSSIQQTATNILMTVNDTRNDLHSEIEQTASSIRSSVYASESMIYSSILETATSIRSEVGNALSDTYSTIEQTASSIWSSVWAEESQIYSFVKQTATYIWERVASKPRVFPQMTSPQGTAEEPLKDGDVWIYSPFIRTWDDAAEHTWDEMEQFQWDNLKGAQVFVRKNGKWQLAIDEITLAKETDLIKTDDYIKLFAKEQVGKNQKVDQYISDLTVTARQIRSDVNASRSELYSSIQQTATNILMTVNNVRNDLHSEIEQTASSIRSSVYADESQIYSSILETATSIRSEVGNALSDTYSTITQTASSIRSEVAAAESTIHSSIQQTASAIRSEVASSISGVNSTITQTADSIRSDVNAANSAIYSSIQQTASGIRSEVADSISGVRSEISQTASSWSAKISGVADANGNVTAASIAIAINASTGESEAKIDAQRVYIGNDKSTTVISGKATLSDVTADFIAGRIANLSVLNVAAVSASGNISTSNGYIMAPYYYLGTSGNARNMASSIHALRIAQNGNTYTLQKQDYNDSDWVDVDSFSRATSLSGAWGSGQLTVTASPQGTTWSCGLGARFTSGGGGYYIEAYRNEGGSVASIPDTSTQISLARSGATVMVVDRNGHQIGSTPTLTMTTHSKCKANLIGEVKIGGQRGKVKMYYLDGTTYKQVFSDSYYWYYSDSYADLATYYS